MFDTVIRGGTVVDGTGAPPFTGDVAVTGGRITAVGKVEGRARRTVDAEGKLVAPGWVDIHTHYDGQATWDTTLAPSSLHGVTTTVFGNCGVGFAPVSPDRHEWLVQLMEGVEDIPGTALSEGITWGWESFPEYLDALARRSFTMDVGACLAHGALRSYVMGDRGANNEAAAPDDIAAMARLVTQAQQAGAFGLSTSRTTVHRARDGKPVPGTYAAMDELTALAEAVAGSGHGVLEVVPAGVTGEDIEATPGELSWMVKVATEVGCPVSFILLQVNGAPELWRDGLAACDKVRAAGGRLTAQVSPRTVGLIIGLRSPYHPFVNAPAWAQLASLTHEQRVQRLRADPDLRRRLAAEGGSTLTGANAGGPGAWGGSYVFEDSSASYEPPPGKSIAALAEREGRDPREFALDKMLGDDGEGLLIGHALNYSSGDLSAAYEMLRHPDTVAAGSDGGAHVRMICDASIPSFLLTHWTRDRSRGPLLPLEFAVKKQTADTADLYALTDRGRLAEGLRADINVIDHGNLRLQRPRLVNDLPAGAARLIQGADGYDLTMVAGVATREGGEDTGARPGRLMRAGRAS
jgi:N-acyl-D-aspartate/D-glutamate deacylase